MLPRPASDEPGTIPPSLIASAAEYVDFVYPGYDGDAISATFLSLPRLDDGGWSGFLSTGKPGRSRVDRPADGILRDRPYYYFHLTIPSGLPSSSSPQPYPIVTRFSDRNFPHRNLPALWARLQLQTSTDIPPPVAAGQHACVASNYTDGVEVAYCVPSNEREWWDSNSMTRYAKPSMRRFSTNPQDVPANLMPLRADLHRVFDERQLCFAPKTIEGPDAATTTTTTTTHDAQTRLLIHVFVPSPNGQVAGLWHNRTLHALPLGLSKECLIARFAYTVLSPSVFCSTFLSSTTVARRLCVRNPVTRKQEVKRESPEGCREILRAARSRSPKKRSAHSPGGGNNGDKKGHRRPYRPMCDSGPDSAKSTDSSDGEWERRGRKRARM
ncbi:hypothetical protein MAPG_10553 [Magnaporthiopsis poae ATCC 64411]|uniref:HNH nuclease domain-containing protein n=1 Tax=Magnaporthiopsis poae (strain ATCC 64411 / 73-15) TaxID=644358 RepID=A0A0C4ECW4_MAGP6|nr:hypothetical protein MAPG_10553 [Magnaporthiopsis poae ATCC 64411]